jgi:ATP phosphoribosyltransferase
LRTSPSSYKGKTAILPGKTALIRLTSTDQRKQSAPARALFIFQEIFMNAQNRKIRIALPNKGLLADGSKKLLEDVGLAVYNPNPRQYIAWIPQLPNIEVIFQRPSDIVISVRDGSVDFGITGRDIYLEKRGSNGSILELHSHLGFGKCTLNVIVPDDWEEVNSVEDMELMQVSMGRPIKVATKFPRLTEEFFS